MADILIGNVKGPQGNQGETGATGAPGAAGADGAAATINVGTVTTSAYGTTAQVTNSGTESAAVFDFVIPQGKPGEETTRMSGLTLDQITAQSATYPIPAVGESGATIWGKVVKFFNDCKTALASKVNVSDIVNNLTSTVTNKPLSAAQGKALNDAITNLQTDVGTRAKIRYYNAAYNMGSIPANSGTSIRINFGFSMASANYAPIIWGTDGGAPINNAHWAIISKDASGFDLYIWNSSNSALTVKYGIAVLL